LGEKYLAYTVNMLNVTGEIVSDAGRVIVEEGQRGQIVVTSFMRRLMPIIRYPMGDMAEWADYSRRKFRLVGREAVGVRMGPHSYDIRERRSVVSNALKVGTLNGFQVLLRRSHLKDEMVFRIASRPDSPDDRVKALREEMDRANQEWAH
jgi:phenylacetate-CoA ligase